MFKYNKTQIKVISISYRKKNTILCFVTVTVTFVACGTLGKYKVIISNKYKNIVNTYNKFKVKIY